MLGKCDPLNFVNMDCSAMMGWADGAREGRALHMENSR